jgi:hypothetical protein
MDTFTMDPRRWRVGRVVARNPLLRRSDRVEALVGLIAVLATLIAIPIAVVAGAIAYDARAQLYAHEAHDRRLVTGTVTDARHQDMDSTVAQAWWPNDGGGRTGTLYLTSPVNAGDSIKLWVDRDGKPTSPPNPAWHAVGDAVGAAGLVVLIAGLGAASLVVAVRSRLDRGRDAQWDRDLRCLVDDGGRTNRQ